MKSRGKIGDAKIDAARAGRDPTDAAAAAREIFADVSGNKTKRGRGRRWPMPGPSREPDDLIDARRRLIFLKGTDAHDYKFSSAVLEDYLNVSPAPGDRFLATSVFNLKGSAMPTARSSNAPERHWPSWSLLHGSAESSSESAGSTVGNHVRNGQHC